MTAALSPEHREKISATLRGKVKDPAWRAKIAESLRSRPRVERKAECHPDRKHHCKGLCVSCYTQRKHNLRAEKSVEARERMKQQQRARKNKSYATNGHEWHLRKTFGITGADYDAMLSAQGGGCAICGAGPTHRRLSVDHCHRTGRIRGVLCPPCNLFMSRVDAGGDDVVERLHAYAAKALRGAK